MERFFEKYPLEDKVVAVGVSGGADSLALVYRLNEYGQKNGIKVVALTVDHQLREESSREAEYVAGLMKKEGIEHHILVWDGDKPQTGIEEAARQARYDLIGQYCREHGIRILAMGHHQQDQAETFLLRLQRGSGVFGLSGILPVSRRENLTVIRPQLEDTPESLKAYLQQKGIEWVEDPSNQNEDFFRVKIRRFLPVLEKELSLSVARLAGTAAVLSRTRDYVETQTDKFIRNNVRFWENAGVSLSEKAFDGQHEEIRFQVISHLIKKIGGKIYTPEADEVLRLCKNVKGGFSGCTLGGCEVFAFRGKIWIVPELKLKEKISRQKWEEFTEKHSQYKKMALPYKLRLSLMMSKPI